MKRFTYLEKLKIIDVSLLEDIENLHEEATLLFYSRAYASGSYLFYYHDLKDVSVNFKVVELPKKYNALIHDLIENVKMFSGEFEV